MNTNASITSISLHISKGNSKTGAIPSFSLPSGKTCSKTACATCYQQGCYARKIERLRPVVRATYKDNLSLILDQPDAVERELNAYFDMPNSTKLFRIHVSGDFFSKEYFELWLRVIRKHPTTKFLAFTKQKDIISPYLNDLPENLSLVWSSWPGIPVPRVIRRVLPVAWMQDGNEKRIPKKAITCPGNCETCARCWALSGHDVVFNKH